eukprot:GHRQ01033524.1.p2 GENE.GHRQ01033524.1~~GHRQ01033524.1.p2  ORF type:complete len:102 (-),score=20.47 GHRQ01033524.1:445-750(-)
MYMIESCPAQVKVTTVDGPVELKIPPGTQPGTTLLMAKRGVQRLGANNVRGNHNVSCFFLHLSRCQLCARVSRQQWHGYLPELGQLHTAPGVAPPASVRNP